MSQRCLSNSIVFIDHKACINNIYSSHQFYDKTIEAASIKPDIFRIAVSYDRKQNDDDKLGCRKSKRRKKAVDNFDDTTIKVQQNHTQFLILMDLPESTDETDNKAALEFVDNFNRNDCYNSCSVFKGANNSEYIVMSNIFSQSYLIPPNCRFFNSDIANFHELIATDERFDFIVLDPPWWNKYIRRTKAANSKIAYQMLDNENIKNIPLENHIHDDTIVVIWCTNSPTHVHAIKEQFLEKWRLKLVGNWYWVKTTKFGQPVCSFNESTKKQPYEQIFLATSIQNSKWDLPSERYIYSIPSAFHSNKPPLRDLFTHLLPEQPKCLEIFARNVYPNFTSIGTEVLKLQNARLFDLVKGK